LRDEQLEEETNNHLRGVDADIWRTFREAFKTLAEEELKREPNNKHDRWLKAHVSYQDETAGCGLWMIYGGVDDGFRARFETEATRAGLALGSIERTTPGDFWLHHIFRDLLKHKSKLLFAPSQDGGIILRVCEASAIYCSRLEKKALESGRERERKHPGTKQFEKKVGAARNLFLEALTRVRESTVVDAHTAWKELLPESDKRRASLAHYAELWLEESVACLRKWFVEFIAIAEAFPEEAQPDGPAEWAKAEANAVLNKSFRFGGLMKNPQSTDSRLAPTTLHWWVRSATQAPPETLSAPARNPRELRLGNFDLGVMFPSRLQYVLNQLTDKAILQEPPLSPARVNGKPEPQQNRSEKPTIQRFENHKRAPLKSYRSELRRAIATALTKRPNATDLEICKSIDQDGTAEVSGRDRTLTSAYMDPKRKPGIQTTIIKLLHDLRKRGLL
jgi:hypothetical protein